MLIICLNLGFEYSTGDAKELLCFLDLDDVADFLCECP